MPAKRAQRRRAPAAFSRVMRCLSVKQFRDAVEKAAKANRLLFALFTQSYNQTCTQMSMFIHDLSTRKEWLHVSFIEVNIQSVQDAVEELGVKGLPGVQCYKNGQCVQNTVYASSAQVLASLKLYAGDPPSRHGWLPGWLLAALQTAVVGAVAAGGWWVYQTHHSQRPQLTGAAAELARLEADIRKTQLSVHMFKKQRGKKKELKAGLAKLKELESRKATIAARAQAEERRRQRAQALQSGVILESDDDISDDDDDLHIAAPDEVEAGVEADEEDE